MDTLFWNRQSDIQTIEKHIGRNTFGYITGRRRIGKTALLSYLCQKHKGFYHQAIEGPSPLHLEHLTMELKETCSIFREIQPKNWTEFFNLLSRSKLPPLLVFDEFPYWVEADPSLPSILQKWVDHELPKQKTLLLISGSCQTMLYSQFLNQGAPLYGRTHLHRHLTPLSYQWFCKVTNYKVSNFTSFERYTLVGGIPHYWKLLEKTSLVQQINDLYFIPSAPLSEEPVRILRDEKVAGLIPRAILDLVGNGVHKPGEMASRLGTAHGNLTRPLMLLLDLGFIHRELPFGESTRTSKRVLYSIKDPPLAFYYGTVIPQKSRWPLMKNEKKTELLHLHASRQWEHFCRQVYPTSSRYWEKGLEIDLVAPLKKEGSYLIAECKWKNLKPQEENTILENLKKKFQSSHLVHKIKKPEFAVFSQKDLGEIAKKEIE